MTKGAEYLIRQALQEKQAYPAALQAIYEQGVQPIARGIEKVPSLLQRLMQRFRGVPGRGVAEAAQRKAMDASAVAGYMPRVQIRRPMVGAGS
jgi:hypothetical protein